MVQECLFKRQCEFQESEVVPEADIAAAHLQELTDTLIEEFSCFFRNTPSLKVRFYSCFLIGHSNQDIWVNGTLERHFECSPFKSSFGGHSDF